MIPEAKETTETYEYVPKQSDSSLSGSNQFKNTYK